MNKDEFLAKYNDILSSYNDLAACVRRQLNYNYPYKPCLDDKNEIFCEDVIDVYTYHHEQLQPWPYGELVRADVSPCRYDGAYMINIHTANLRPTKSLGVRETESMAVGD